MPTQLDFKVTGEETIHCASCEQRIDTALHRLPGVQNVQASSRTQGIKVTIDPDQVKPEDVRARLEKMGYEVQQA
ncbi:cation transporter [Deinococcus peraridilitoris]|uniref:Copper chaperone n=1 Tax=Deinococcus peraridilitoris (strain DSM 19664 / LMG 22246 / CIP 109416 / KR-200) TaxID=937777 RepID=L0A7Y2_DEIPD|nr:heavy-metal-associated domain-containing protein [Deinococcus peraridilitoris]AFZ69292.1 copper chaperone [Deinococcus peraridilitoris DSM 19664]